MQELYGLALLSLFPIVVNIFFHTIHLVGCGVHVFCFFLERDEGVVPFPHSPHRKDLGNHSPIE